MTKSFGVKVSQRDYDVRDAKDYKLEYSSAFPMLPIVDSGAFANANDETVLSTHGLDFVPMFWVHHDDQNFFATGSASEAHALSGNSSKFFRMDGTNLRYMDAPGASAPANTNGYFYVYGVDIETAFTAPIKESGTDDDTTSDSNLYGIKVSKDGKDVNSTDLRDFAIHSGTRSPMIHSVTPGTGNSGTITHNLGYLPFHMVYYKFNTHTEWVLLTAASDSGVTVSTTALTFNVSSGGGSDSYSVVIFKDPLTVS